MTNTVTEAMIEAGKAAYLKCHNDGADCYVDTWIEAIISAALPNPSPTACVGEMKTSAGSDYYVCVRVGNRELTPHMHKIRSRAEYEVAEWLWLFNGGEKPDILAYREDASS